MSWSGPAYTPVNIPPFKDRIRYGDSVLMVGSCFTDHIAKRLERYKYRIRQNPFGILYNPVSIANSLHRIAEKKYYAARELVFHAGLYHSMDHHGSYSGTNAEDVVQSINLAIDEAHDHLAGSKYIFISPGTSRVYRLKDTGNIAGNCHKMPQARFENSMLPFQEIQAAFEQIHQLVKGISPAAYLTWTVSPVRHIRDGLVENQQSKSLLLLASATMTKEHENNAYFPAYEIMMDQLRDYRYYAKDLVHPSEEAVDIIWDLFGEHYLAHDNLHLHAMIDKINFGMQHRFLHARPDAIHDFARAQLDLIDRTQSLVPELDFSKETLYFTSLIAQQIF